ncbi:MAG: CAP domain-containing protein, partial [Anaerolineaceae bacterium]
MGQRRRGGALALALGVLASFMLALAALAHDGGSARALTNCTVSDGALDGEEQAFLGLINQYRASNGLDSLAVSTSLSRAAAWMSRDLGVNAYFSHTDSLGRSPSTRAMNCDYPAGAGENIAGGTAWSSAQSVFDGWKASAGHNANMLTGSYRVIGIGRVNVPGSPYGWYWTTDFGNVDDSGSPPPTNTPTNTPTSAATVPLTSTPATSATATPTAAPATSTPTATGTSAAATPTTTPPTAAPATNTPTAASGGSTSTPTPTSAAAATPTSTPTASAATPTTTQTPTPVPEAATIVPLASGANLIAWPASDRTATQGFGGAGNTISIVYSWDPSTETWRRYGPSLPGFLNNLTALRRGDAYWV